MFSLSYLGFTKCEPNLVSAGVLYNQWIVLNQAIELM